MLDFGKFEDYPIDAGLVKYRLHLVSDDLGVKDGKFSCDSHKIFDSRANTSQAPKMGFAVHLRCKSEGLQTLNRINVAIKKRISFSLLEFSSKLHKEISINRVSLGELIAPSVASVVAKQTVIECVKLLEAFVPEVLFELHKLVVDTIADLDLSTYFPGSKAAIDQYDKSKLSELLDAADKAGRSVRQYILAEHRKFERMKECEPDFQTVS